MKYFLIPSLLMLITGCNSKSILRKNDNVFFIFEDKEYYYGLPKDLLNTKMDLSNTEFLMDTQEMSCEIIYQVYDLNGQSYAGFKALKSDTLLTHFSLKKEKLYYEQEITPLSFETTAYYGDRNTLIVYNKKWALHIFHKIDDKRYVGYNAFLIKSIIKIPKF